MTHRFHGILPALITPLTSKGDLSPHAMKALLRRVYDAGSHGVYVCGSTGEGLLLPVEIRREITEVAVRCSPPDKVVIVHVGASRTEDAFALAAHAAAMGAHAVASLPPLGPYRFDEVRACYERLASASSLPFFVYFFPEIAPYVTGENIAELVRIPHVAGVKFTDFNLFRLSQLRQSGLTVFNGRDEVLAAGLLMGANGGIGSFYNLIPETFVALYEHAVRGEWAEAKTAQDSVNELIALVLRFPMLPAMKTMLAWSGIDCGPCVEPRRALTSGEKDQLADALAQSSFANAVFAPKGATR
ncbi:MAG: dihydrodipicolinate synthase family protein [Acidobacteriota bacterium]|nr:dihydrodipicolinate synthase family protein [Acidobacteriota bacterium]